MSQNLMDSLKTSEAEPSSQWADEKIALIYAQHPISDNLPLEKKEQLKTRRQKIKDVLEEFHADGGIQYLKDEIEIQKAIKLKQRKNFNRLDKEVIIRGHLFEQIALTMREKISPENKKTSEAILEMVRRPHTFLDNLSSKVDVLIQDKENRYSNDEIKSFIDIQLLCEDKKTKLKKYTRNSDAIEIQFQPNDKGEVQAVISATVEMKNYLARGPQDVRAITSQLKDSAEDLREVVTELDQLYTVWAVLTDSSLPRKISLVEEENFDQIVVQPQGMFSTESQQEKYAEQFGKYGVEFVNINMRELSKLYDAITPEILDTRR